MSEDDLDREDGPTDDVDDDDEASAPATRQRGTIRFPYADLNESIAVARVAFETGGRRSLDRLPTRLGHQTINSGAFRNKVAAARLFGLIRRRGLDVEVTDLGQRIIDDRQEAAARVEAFLNVPLFRQVFEMHRAGVLPGPEGLQAVLRDLGVAPKQVERARQIFQRVAEQAGFFREGRDRLVMPHVDGGAAPRHEDPDRGTVDLDEDDGSNGNGEENLSEHPLIQGLFKMLPSSGPWPRKDRDRWLKAASLNFDLIYGTSDEEATSSASEPEPPSWQSQSAQP